MGSNKRNSSKLTKLVISGALLTIFANVSVIAAPVPPLRGYKPAISTLIGNDDQGNVVGSGFQNDNSVVLGVNLGATNLGAASTNIAGATAASSGAVIRLNAEGTAIQTITRVASKISDLCVDKSDDCIYVAAGEDGLIKISPDGRTSPWKKMPSEAESVNRVDASNGVIAVIGSGNIYTFDKNGNETGKRGDHHRTTDVCYDPASQTVITIGWRQANAPAGNRRYPVQISNMYGHNVTGAMDVKWKNYDWSTDRNSPDFINKPKNNMADTRSDVCSMGDDGMLYAAFEAAGGNHIFRYDAKNISNGVGDKLKKGDWYHDFYRSASDHKTVFGRYNPGTGDVIYIKQFCCRLLSDESRGKTNTATPSAIAADKDGKVYVGGGSAFGLPIPNSRVNATGKTTKYSQVSYKNVASGWNPGDDEDWDYTGGGWLLIISSDFTERLHCSRVAMSARVNTIAARARDGLVPVVVFGGFKSNKNSTIYLENEFQSELSSNEDETKTGWFTIYNTTNNIDVRRQMVAKLPHLSRVSLSNGGIKVEKEGVNRIAIYAISGALVKNYKVSVGETIVPELSTGTYMVQVHSKNSVQSLRYSVIK